jgi:phosphoribosylformylglycinamidine synthase
VGADPRRIAILDNFCWGDCERPETLGSLVRAAIACHDVAIVLGTPFISGKDSLNNEFSYTDAASVRQTIAIPPSLLISAIGQIDDVAKCVTMDLKEPGNLLYLVGETRDELGGSHIALVNGLAGGHVPTVDPQRARDTFAAVHRAISGGLVRACHDLSEGGLAVAAAEMAFSGGLGVWIGLDNVSSPLWKMEDESAMEPLLLFSESNSRFLCEVAVEQAAKFESLFGGIDIGRIGEVRDDGRMRVYGNSSRSPLIDADIDELKAAWQATFRW